MKKYQVPMAEIIRLSIEEDINDGCPEFGTATSVGCQDD